MLSKHRIKGDADVSSRQDDIVRRNIVDGGAICLREPVCRFYGILATARPTTRVVRVAAHLIENVT